MDSFGNAYNVLSLVKHFADLSLQASARPHFGRRPGPALKGGFLKMATIKDGSFGPAAAAAVAAAGSTAAAAAKALPRRGNVF